MHVKQTKEYAQKRSKRLFFDTIPRWHLNVRTGPQQVVSLTTPPEVSIAPGVSYLKIGTLILLPSNLLHDRH